MRRWRRQIDIGPFPDTLAGGLTPPQAGATTRTAGHFALTAIDDAYTARALVGGPRVATAQLSVVASANIGSGIALIGRQLGPGRALVGRLVPGEMARIERLAGGSATTVCTGQLVTADQLAGTVGLTITGTTASLELGPAGGTAPIAICDLSSDPDLGARGQWGVAPAGGAGAHIELTTVKLVRAP